MIGVTEHVSSPRNGLACKNCRQKKRKVSIAITTNLRLQSNHCESAIVSCLVAVSA